MKKLMVGCDKYNLTETIVESFESLGNAEPTSRLLEGSSDSWADQEWSEPVKINGQECTIYYLFSEEDMQDEDGEPLQDEDYPFDQEHVSYAEILE